ncbi:MAG: hypothetical protein H8D45_27275 [Bacteroidetes bacterium]|nr:hypothetical protein [Bacteroidota bacterium]
MKTEELKESLGQEMQKASSVDVTLNTAGWKIFEKIVEETKKELNQLKGIKTIKELQARQLAEEKIDKMITDFKGIRFTGIKAKQDLDNLESTK